MAEEEPVDTPPVEEPQGPVIPDGVSLPEGLELILTEDEIADFFKYFYFDFFFNQRF